MVRKLQVGDHEVDRKLDEADIQLFGHADPISGSWHAKGGKTEDASSDEEEDNEGLTPVTLVLETCRAGQREILSILDPFY